MPKTKRKRSVKTVRSIKKAASKPTAAAMKMADNRLVIAALVLLLAVAIFMLVEAWTGVR